MEGAFNFPVHACSLVIQDTLRDEEGREVNHHGRVRQLDEDGKEISYVRKFNDISSNKGDL